MLVATLIMVVGISVVALVSQRQGYRMGGVMVVPLVVIYTIREPFSPLIFVLGAAAAWASLWAVREYTLTHGRRVFLVAVVTGALATVVVAFVVSRYVPARLPFENAEMVASIFPGIAAYNFMRLDPADRPNDALAMCLVFAVLLVLGVAALFAFESRPAVTPPVLALPTSDLLDWLGIRPQGSPMRRLTPRWLSVSLLVVDVVIYEWFRKRYDLRLAGIIVIPLLAIFSVRLASTVVVYALGATATFALVSAVHWITLLYGRVLLGIALVCGLLYVLALGLWLPLSLPGLTLFFVGLFVGVSAYNLHRVAPRNRSATIRVSAGLFVLFYAVLVVVVDVPPGGLLYSFEPVFLVVGLAVVGLAAVAVYRLERSLPDATAFAQASVFANAEVDGATLVDSPLVRNEEEAE